MRLLHPLDGNGTQQLTARRPAGIAGPFTVRTQAWMADPDAAHGFSASNVL